MRGVLMKDFSLIDFTAIADDIIFFRRTLPASLKKQLPYLLNLQGKPGAYAGMFAMPSCDSEKEFRTLTGELIKSRAARMHIAGEDVCRIIRKLFISDSAAKSACEKAEQGMIERIYESDEKAHTKTGVYCCGSCSVSLWRNLLAGAYDHQEERLRHGLKELKSCRDGKGSWRRFPFYYTALALSEMDCPEAEEEKDYIKMRLESLVKRLSKASSFDPIRLALAERILGA